MTRLLLIPLLTLCACPGEPIVEILGGLSHMQDTGFNQLEAVDLQAEYVLAQEDTAEEYTAEEYTAEEYTAEEAEFLLE